MSAHITSYDLLTPRNGHTSRDVDINLNRLRRGTTYMATTPTLVAIGEYLGMESPHGERAILLRNATGTDSIWLDDVTSIGPAA